MSQLVHTPSEALPEASAPFRFLTWRQTWRLAVVVGCLLLAYAPVLAHLLRQWWDEPDYSHGFIVPVFALWVLWERRDELRSIAPRPHWAGLAVIVLSLVLLVLGTFGAELFLQRISLPLLIAGLVLWFRGWPTLRASAFPLLVLLLAIPFPGVIYFQIVFPLQILASRLATWFLHAIDLFPVLREGNVIVLSNTRLEVAEACSGIRSLMSLFTLAVFYGYFMEKSLWKRVALVLASIPIAIAANAVRIVGTGLCVQYWDPDKAMGFFHEFSGWVVFLVSLACLYLVNCAMLLVPFKRVPFKRRPR